MSSEPDLAAIGARIERLLVELRVGADPRRTADIDELLRLVTELYGAGLARVVEVVGAVAPDAMDALSADELLSGLLALHDLHPDALTTRVERALEGVRPLLARHGGDVELVDLDPDAGAVLLRLLGSCDGCPSSAMTLQHAVERAILDAAPEIGTVDVEQATPAAVTTGLAIGTKPAYDHCPTEVTV